MSAPLHRDGEKPLRILAVLNYPWDRRLGVARVWVDLAEQWRAAGHTVDQFTLSDAFPKPTRRRIIVAWRQVAFAYRAAKYIRKNAQRYDVIDCLLETLPFSKKQLGFKGLLVGRSVGSYRFYEDFEAMARQRWPAKSKGKLAGRIFHALLNWHALKAVATTTRMADLLNLPNENERAASQSSPDRDPPAIVQPYGLRPEEAQALAAAAAPVNGPSEEPRISFIGMWGLRKGAKDWGEIVRRIRAEIPGARFRFLGVMTDQNKILQDLELPTEAGLEIIQEFEPSELPELLRDCAVGIFPSYIEGFGIGVIEQLAAGIPTVAYDVPGPRQILESQRETLLVAAGDVGSLVEKVLDLLRMDAGSAARQRAVSQSIAAQYSWTDIAADTIRAYREALPPSRPLVFVHPFGLRSAGGGPRILRALLKHSPIPFLSVCTSPHQPPASDCGHEIHLPVRPDFGRIERTRFAGLPHLVTPLLAGRFARRLEANFRAVDARAVHAIPHGGLDFHQAFKIAKKLGLPYFLQVHDDLIYGRYPHISEPAAHAAIREAWLGADARFVISEQMGAEYCRRYGAGDYAVITDGLEEVAAAPVERSGNELRIYFMGMFHLSYEENLRVLLEALEQLRSEGTPVSMTLRCGGLRASVTAGHENILRILPFASEADVQRDFESADLLYLPLPFQKEQDLLVRFSFSTKMVTYLGSGIPVLYHGPQSSAVYDSLRQHDAALLTESSDPAVVAQTLRAFLVDRAQGIACAARGLRLVRQEFMLGDIAKKFWGSVLCCIEQ
ncbi:MAG: glycosyltransferase [Spartobacteria bacterium]